MRRPIYLSILPPYASTTPLETSSPTLAQPPIHSFLSHCKTEPLKIAAPTISPLPNSSIRIYTVYDDNGQYRDLTTYLGPSDLNDFLRFTRHGGITVNDPNPLYQEIFGFALETAIASVYDEVCPAQVDDAPDHVITSARRDSASPSQNK